MNEEVLRNMQERVERFRRLAKTTTDEKTAIILRQMAEEIAADMLRITQANLGGAKRSTRSLS